MLEIEFIFLNEADWDIVARDTVQRGKAQGAKCGKDDIIIEYIV
jgi:hypothetical protein